MLMPKGCCSRQMRAKVSGVSVTGMLLLLMGKADLDF